MKIKEFFTDIGKGAAIGASCLIPGISGGTIALSLGIYKKLINSISSLTSNFKKSFITLIPIALGVILGIVTLWIPLDYALQYFLFGTICLFTGFILGGIPTLVEPIKNKKPKIFNIIIFLITFLFIIGLSIVSVKFHINADSQFETPYSIALYFELIAIGIIASFALIIPGISGSMILLILGFYENILSLINNFKNGTYVGETIGLFLCLILGVLIGAILVSKLLKHILVKHEQTFLWGILGFILGSVFSIFYNTRVIEYFSNIQMYEGILGFFLLIIGFIAVALFSKFAKVKEFEE